jgi:hypothetical protein
MARHRLIWFCDIESVAADVAVLARLRDQIGLTTIMPESSICHTSGFRAGQALADASPFADWRSRTDVWEQGKQGVYPPVAGIIGGFDDAPLLKVIAACKAAGIEVWGHIGLWSYGGDVYPEYAMRDIDDRPLDMRYKQWGIGLCPSNQRINQWTRDGLVEAARRYDLDGFCVDHARYPAPANLHSLLACGCQSCQAEADRLGYDFSQMRRGLKALVGRVAALRREEVVALAQEAAGFDAAFNLLGEGEAVRDWLSFRSQVMAGQMAGFRSAVQAAAGEHMVFGSDVFPPSIALLGGHDYEQWAGGADYLTGGASFGGVVGWATTVSSLAGEWAPALCGAVKGLQEAEALAWVYQLFGYGDLGLPYSLDGLKNNVLPLENIFAHEVQKLKVQVGESLPLYPPVSAQGDTERVRRLCRAVADAGCDGAMLGLDPNKAENLAVLCRELSH